VRSVALRTILALLAILASPAVGQVEIVRDGEPRAVICIPAEPHRGETIAAEEIRRYVRKISGAELVIVRGDPPAEGPAILIGRCAGTEGVLAELDRRCGESYDRLAVVTEGERLILTAPTKLGVVRAAWDFLRKCGVRWLMPGERGEYVPRSADVVADPWEIYDAPAIPSRTAYGMSERYGHPAEADELAPCGAPHDSTFSARCGGNLNSTFLPEFADSAWYYVGSGHSYQYYLPIKWYFEDHPEWFEMRKGRRFYHKTHWQVCYTNPEAAATFARNINKSIASHIERGNRLEHLKVCISPNDTKAFCHCRQCAPLEDKDGSSTSQVFTFANRAGDFIRKEYPRAHFTVFAYYNHSTPPDHLLPEPGVRPELCHWSAGISFAYNHAEPGLAAANEKFRDGFEWYVENSDAVSIWAYYGHYNWFTPWPMTTQMAYDIPRMVETGKLYSFYSESHLHWGTQGLNFWLLSRLLREPDLDVEAAIDDYCRAAYGPAAADMREYYRILQDRMDALTYVCGTVWEVPHLLTEEVCAKCDERIEAAMSHLDEMDENTAWRTRLAGEAWKASEKYARAVRLARAGGSDAQRREIVRLCDDVAAFARSDLGRWAFENGLTMSSIEAIARPFRVELSALPPGETVFSEGLYYGGALEFHAEIEGFQQGLWGLSLPVAGAGTIELPLAAEPGHRLAAASVRWGTHRNPEITVTAIAADGSEYVLADGPDEAPGELTIPVEALGERLTLRVRAKNRHYDPSIVLTTVRLKVTVE
jgi:hypothetical protein